MPTPAENWKLVWSEEFDTPHLNPANWNRQVEPAGRFNQEWQRYTDDEKNAYIENGQLIIKAIHETDQHNSNQYTSARLNTSQKQTFRYGKIAARIKLPHGPGIWPALWMLGANCDENGGDTPWPKCGEIDILELYGSNNDAIVEANIHYANHNHKHAMLTPPQYQLPHGIFADDFHLFEIIWNKDQIQWLVDGTPYASTPITHQERKPFHQEFYLLLNIAIGGEWAGRPDVNTTFPQTMTIDWIRVYQMKED